MKATRARYTLEFKLEAVRLAKAGQSVAATAKMCVLLSRRWAAGSRLTARGG